LLLSIVDERAAQAEVAHPDQAADERTSQCGRRIRDHRVVPPGRLRRSKPDDPNRRATDRNRGH
jgi:hypothetical protein